ncbi:alkaline shock response membrane anchor protein AmaP [Weissella cibaria]|uniref:alkaline shock response membrane anchor protein AmaP n=1 Tax=Weissella cibaria TaxID=137591 RepID=UPI000FFE20C8|nr:alkaline shock response membrane anchor protein AmaP [Weissella cibaria]MBZ6070649.1 alkaline shock response membrane anchor protein AmaP [Weissella cibaria]MCS8561220.1 alkaline shock response membrane anchor protein AmaP [Weissella cibaria]MCS8565353.1 alkaline shock response membrane anchor protein AmaP [Weissella cibaria]MCS8577308.1 alkaline shock response membrane anchor protein AmaP [Weissella cibaria]QAT26572.1 alkaline shock response membrane anchor protein AmaP [Weissella cibaria]
MKRLYKVLLVIILLIYLISISTIIWPDIITKILLFLDHINLHSSLSEQMLLRYNELFILGLTSVILIVVIALPRQRKSILLINSGKGTLSLGNEGISSFIKTQLSGEGLSNIQVNIKNTKHIKRFNVTADSEYKKSIISDLPRVEKNLTDSLRNLLSGVDKSPIRVNIKVNQSNKRNNKASRVI